MKFEVKLKAGTIYIQGYDKAHIIGLLNAAKLEVKSIKRVSK